MKIRKLEELQKIHSDIKLKKETNKEENIEEKEAMLLTVVKRVMDLSRTARTEGLLALEEAISDISLDSEEEGLRQLVLLMLDGTEPEIIQGIGMARYYSHLYQDYQALRYFLYLEGVLSIQAGENLWILEEKLKTMLPPHMYVEYSLKKEQQELEERRKKEEKLIEDLCKGERLWNTGENGYYISKLTDYVVCDITDKELQRVMREVDNVTLALAMKGMSGKARRHIFSNLSERLGKLIAEDMKSLRPVRAVDILEASQKLLAVIIHLIEQGEVSDRYKYLEPFYLMTAVNTKPVKQKNEKLEELKELIQEYEKGAELVREIE